MGKGRPRRSELDPLVQAIGNEIFFGGLDLTSPAWPTAHYQIAKRIVDCIEGLGFEIRPAAELVDVVDAVGAGVRARSGR